MSSYYRLYSQAAGMGEPIYLPIFVDATGLCMTHPPAIASGSENPSASISEQPLGYSDPKMSNMVEQQINYSTST